MADAKISSLPASTTPLAGTEVLPIVQSGVTKQISVANLTIGRSVTTGPLTALGGNGNQFVLNNNGEQYVQQNFSVNSILKSLLYWDNSANKFTLGSTGATSQTAIISTGVERMVFDASGNALLNTGNLVIGTAGKGIDFSADGQAAGMTSELLDDYEEGTFTPTYTSTGTPPTVTYSHQYGKYTKIGRQVFFTVEIGTNSATTGTGVLAIGGLPFTSVNDRYSGTLSVGYADSFTTASPCGAYIGANSTITQLTHESSVTARTDMLTSFLTDGAGQNYLIISGSYMV